jgi:hypothetical protein
MLISVVRLSERIPSGKTDGATSGEPEKTPTRRRLRVLASLKRIFDRSIGYFGMDSRSGRVSPDASGDSRRAGSSPAPVNQFEGREKRGGNQAQGSASPADEQPVGNTDWSREKPAPEILGRYNIAVYRTVWRRVRKFCARPQK